MRQGHGDSGEAIFPPSRTSQCAGPDGLLESVFPHLQAPGWRRLRSRRHLPCGTYHRQAIIITVANIKGAATVRQARCGAPVLRHSYLSHPSSTLILSVRKRGPREGKQLGRRGTGRIPNRVCLTPNPLRFASQPQHAASTAGRPGGIVV